MNTYDKEDIINYLTLTNELDYNLLKAAEECTELSEVLLKKVLKRGEQKEPPNSAIIEEIGDVAIRLAILTKLFGEDEVLSFGEDEVLSRILYKENKYRDYILNEKYKGKI